MDYLLVEKMNSEQDTNLKDVVFIYFIPPYVFYIQMGAREKKQSCGGQGGTGVELQSGLGELSQIDLLRPFETRLEGNEETSHADIQRFLGSENSE